VRVIAIDPGVTGALAVLESAAEPGKPPSILAVHDLPSYAEKTSSGKTKNYIDPVALHKLIKSIGKVDRIICERLTSPPGISSVVAFSLGATSGTIASVLRLSGNNYKLVSPSVWKRAFDCPADKELARQYATRIFANDEHWQRKKQHNRAEAALIGAWFLMTN
jgi:hypothetical protein